MYPYKAVENDHYLQKSKELFKIFFLQTIIDVQLK